MSVPVRTAVETATVTRVTRRLCKELGSLTATSRTARLLRRVHSGLQTAWTDSRTDQFSQWSTDRLTRGSTLVAVTTATTGRIEAVARTARPQAAITERAHWVLEATRASFLYRWLTAEPEPDVIVIDLRETYTAGPIISGIDRTIAELTPGIESATFTEALRSTGRIFAKAPVRYLSMILLVLVAASLLGQSILRGAPEPTHSVLHVVVGVLAAAGVRVSASAADLRASKLGRWLADAFEPPSPPEPKE